MTYNNYLIESDTLVFPAIEQAIRSLLLDGIDVRLTPVSRNRALLPRHILDAIRAQYGIDPIQYLQSKGLAFDHLNAVADEVALALLAHRAPAELDARAAIPVQAVDGVAWHLTNINAPQAWALLGGPDAIAWKCKVGQIDTGFMPHPALGFAGGVSPWLLTAECKNFYAPDLNSSNVVGMPNGEDPCSGPFWGHGTRIGATISGWTSNGDGGKAFYGCAPKVPHVVTRISNTVLINDQLQAFAEALNYLVDVAQVDVVNLSMGVFPSYLSPAAKTAVNNAYSNGVILICAGGQYVSPVVAPAAYGRTIAVGGSTNTDQFWANASRGPQIDWCAPAAEIRRATRDRSNGPFVYSDKGDGTSYATALSTGVAALWLTHRYAQITAAYGKTWQRVHAFKQIAKKTTRRPAVWGDGLYGTGILNALAVLNAPLPVVDPTQQEPAI
jgi:hypothetical protein